MITLDNLDFSSKQEIFNFVVNHLLTQGKQALRDSQSDIENNCAYKTPNGLKCAAGCLIKEDEYSADMEGVSAEPALRRSNSCWKRCSHHIGFISELQNIHDNYQPHTWPARLQALAQRNSLNYTGPTITV